MRIRAANSVDAPALVAILVDAQARSRFAGLVGVDEPFARKLLAHSIHRHGGTTEGASFVEVAESKGRIEAFIFGHLSRVYLIGDKLCAQDGFLVGYKDTDPRALPLLLDDYIAWASGNPRVFEINASFTDALPGAERFDAVYLRKGFTRCGAIYRRSPTPVSERLAA